MTSRSAVLIMRGVVGLIVLIWAFPILWVAYSSFKPADLIISRSLTVLFEPTLAHYRTIFETQNFARFAVNSLIVASVSTAICVVLGFLAAYGMARFRAGGNSFALWVLVTRMAPPAAVLIPFYLMFRVLGLIHTLTGLVVVDVALNLSFAIWILRTLHRRDPRRPGGIRHGGRGLATRRASGDRVSAGPPRHRDHGNLLLRVCLERVSLRAASWLPRHVPRRCLSLQATS